MQLFIVVFIVALGIIKVLFSKRTHLCFNLLIPLL